MHRVKFLQPVEVQGDPGVQVEIGDHGIVVETTAQGYTIEVEPYDDSGEPLVIVFAPKEAVEILLEPVDVARQKSIESRWQEMQEWLASRRHSSGY